MNLMSWSKFQFIVIIATLVTAAPFVEQFIILSDKTILNCGEKDKTILDIKQCYVNISSSSNRRDDQIFDLNKQTQNKIWKTVVAIKK